MAYKVIFNTYAILTGGASGNIIQSEETIYTDKEIKDIPDSVNSDLLPRARVADIITIEKVKGKCLT